MWDKLTAILPFDGFRMVKNGRSQLANDGTDITLVVISNNIKHVVFNGYDDPTHYQVLIPFISYLQDEVIPIAKKITAYLVVIFLYSDMYCAAVSRFS